MTHEEAKTALDSYELSHILCPTMHTAFGLAREALEKQIPKKPPNHDGMVCPNCNSKARYGHPYEFYCPHCGQAIDWSEEE